MLKYILTFVFALVISSSCFTQSFYIEWQTCAGGSSDDYGNFMKLVVGNQAIAVVGNTDSDDGNAGCSLPGNTDALEFIIDTLGNALNSRCYGGSGYDEFNHFIEYGPLDYKYLIGRTSSNDGDVAGNHGSYDAWLVKTSFNGVIHWQKCLGGTGWEDGFNILATSDGNLLTMEG